MENGAFAPKDQMHLFQKTANAPFYIIFSIHDISKVSKGIIME